MKASTKKKTRAAIRKSKADLEALREIEVLEDQTICGLPPAVVEQALEKANSDQKGKLCTALDAASDFEFWRLYRQRWIDEEEKNLRSLGPRDTVEKMLCQQMATLHRKCMDYIGREGLGEQDAMNQAIRCMRVFTGQVEALAHWRSKGTQVVRVEHVQLNVGGQAIMQ